MTKKKQPADLKTAVEEEIKNMMSASGEPSEGRMKLLKTAIGFLAVQAKLEESEYGGFFGDDPAGVQKQPRAEPAGRSDAPDAEPGGDGDFFPEGGTSDLPH